MSAITELSSMFSDPRIATPRDGERVQYKVTGDPEVHKITEPSIGTFKRVAFINNPNLIGQIVDEKTNNVVEVNLVDDLNEVAQWRPISEYQAMLH